MNKGPLSGPLPVESGEHYLLDLASFEVSLVSFTSFLTVSSFLSSFLQKNGRTQPAFKRVTAPNAAKSNRFFFILNLHNVFGD